MSRENAGDNVKRSPALVTAVGVNQFCDSCINTFLQQEKIGFQAGNKYVVEHHQSLDDLSLAFERGCPLCARTVATLFEDRGFIAVHNTATDFSNTQIRISKILLYLTKFTGKQRTRPKDMRKHLERSRSVFDVWLLRI